MAATAWGEARLPEPHWSPTGRPGCKGSGSGVGVCETSRVARTHTCRVPQVAARLRPPGYGQFDSPHGHEPSQSEEEPRSAGPMRRGQGLVGGPHSAQPLRGPDAGGGGAALEDPEDPGAPRRLPETDPGARRPNAAHGRGTSRTPRDH